MASQTQWDDITDQVNKIIADIPEYWKRPTRTHYAIQVVDTLKTGQQPTPRGWKETK